MNKNELKNWLNFIGVDESDFSLHGKESHDTHVLSKENGKWKVFYYERGTRRNEKIFSREQLAYRCLLNEFITSIMGAKYGLSNFLYHRYNCTNCGTVNIIEIRFFYAFNNLFKYIIDDKLKWFDESRDSTAIHHKNVGDQNNSKVRVEGIVNDPPVCRTYSCEGAISHISCMTDPCKECEIPLLFFDIFVKNNVINTVEYRGKVIDKKVFPYGFEVLES